MRVVESLKSNYSGVFDFQDPFVLGPYSFDLYARYYQENTRYFGSKKLEIYSFSNNEHLFYRTLGDRSIDFEELRNFYLYMCNEFIQPDDKHMSTVITVIYAVDKLEESERKQIQSFKFYKSYLFGLKGYVHGKLIVLDLSQNKAYENKFARGDAARLKLLA
ncbi:MAG: hypothetical protein Q4A72_04720 [Bacillota bacterium]|nr:hypothetical protein [Bacillota bacterium]